MIVYNQYNATSFNDNKAVSLKMRLSLNLNKHDLIYLSRQFVNLYK